MVPGATFGQAERDICLTGSIFTQARNGCVVLELQSVRHACCDRRNVGQIWRDMNSAYHVLFHYPVVA